MNVLKKQPSILIIIALIGFPQISESIFTPVLPQLSHSMAISGHTTQLTMSTYFFAFAFGVLCFGALSDRIGRRQAMLIGLCVYLIGNVGLLLSSNFHWLISARMVQAFGAAAGSVITQTIMREAFTGVERERVFSKVGAALALSPALGPLLGGVVQAIWGYRSVFSTLVIMAVVLIFYVTMRLPETRNNLKQECSISWWFVTKKLITSPRIWGFGLLISGVNGILFSYYAEAPFIFINNFRLSTIQYGFTGILIALSILIGSMISNYLANKLEALKIIKIGLLVTIVGAITMYIGVNNIFILLGSILLTFTGLNILLPITLSQALIGFESVIGTASGFFSLGYYLVISLLTFLMSIMHDGSVHALPLYIVFIVTGMLFSLILIKRS